MKKAVLSSIMVVALMGAAVGAFAQVDPTASHTVTVSIAPLNTISVDGNVNIDILDTDFVGGNASKQGTANLSWLTNETNKKITIQDTVSDGAVAGQDFGLTVEATGLLGHGTPSGNPFTLVNMGAAVDYIDGVSQEQHTTPLVYTATATIASPVDTEQHLIVYTLTDA